MTMRWWGALGMVLVLVTCREATEPVAAPDAAPTPLAASLVPIDQITVTPIIGSGPGNPCDEWDYLAINDLGLVAGGNECNQGGAFFWDGSTWYDLTPDAPCPLDSPSGLPYVEVTGQAYDINNAGQVMGQIGRVFCDMSSSYHSFIWRAGVMTEHDWSFNPGWINDLGQVLGWTVEQAVLWDGDMPISLGEFNPIGLNNRGQVIGSYSDGYAGVLWDNGTLTQLSFRPMAINDLGQIVGSDGPPAYGGVLWNAGVTTSLPGHPVDINNIGQVLMHAPRGDPELGDCAVWQGGVVRWLPDPEGHERCDQLYEINNRGQVLGHVDIRVAIIWETLRPATPREEADVLTRMVRALVTAGDLPRAEGGSLLWTLDNIKKQLDQGKCRTAKQGFKTFINKVRSYVGDGLLKAEDAAPLLSGARDAYNVLPC